MKNLTSHAVKLANVYKEYLIHHEKPTLSEKLMLKKSVKFRALTNINLEIEQKQRIGFIGANGSGKTTLLKLITGITSPTKGSIHVNGKVVSLIDLEAGFHPDLTGIQNIFLNGSIIGMSNKEINDKLDKIIEFAEIGQFIDTPLFTYSQGMKLRLGFSVAVHADPDILILDENLSVGDIAFTAKSHKKIKEFFEMDKTIIIASHDLEFIKNNCNRTVWLKDTKIIMDSSPAKVIKSYTQGAITK